MKTTILFTLLLCSYTLFSQSCLPDGITFSSQQGITDFTTLNPTCTTIEGNVTIQGITNFIGLEQITTIEGGIICNECTGFQNFQGLNSLSSLGFLSWDEGGEFEFEGLDSLVTVTDFINLSEANFGDFSGLESLNTVGGDFIVQECQLSGFNGLLSFNSIGGSFIIEENNNLFTLSIFGGISEIGGDLIIEDNPVFANIQSFIGLDQIGGSLRLEDNPSITELAGLNNIETIGGELFIEHMPLLPDLNELDELTSIDGAISLLDNVILNDITGLANIDPDGISALQIAICPQLSACSIESICGFLNISPQFSQIGDNLTDCNTTAEIIANCAVNSVLEIEHDSFSLQFNLIENELIIQSDQVRDYTILNILGQVQQQFRNTGGAVDVSGLSTGMYLIQSEQGGRTLKFQKL